MQAVTRPAVKNPELRSEADARARGERARADLGRTGAATCTSCGADVWRYRTSGAEQIIRFDEHLGGSWDHPKTDASDVARRAARGRGALRLHVCGRRPDEEPLP